MQALILVGGEGTRLRPLTEAVPKPVVPLVDRPFISYMVEWLARHGVSEVVMACGFGAGAVRDVLGDGQPGGPRLRYVEEPQPLGTAGAIRHAAEHLEDRFLALNGDVLTDLDLTALVRFHEERGSRATLGLYPVDDPTGYGLVETDQDGRIVEFLEKPEPGHGGPGEVNTGTYVLERSVLEAMIPEGRAVSIEREVFPELIGKGLHGLRLEGYWMDIGTPDRYLQASWDILERRVATAVADRLDESGSHLADGADRAADAQIGATVLIEDGATVGSRASVGPRAVLMPGCRVGEGAVVESSVLHRRCVVGDGAEVRGAILSPGAEVGDGAKVGPGSVIGSDERVAE
ncbi:MAG: NDP-sugar synthase [Actinomycetota bacterium]